MFKWGRVQVGDLPSGFVSEFVHTGTVNLHLVHNIVPDDARTPILFLHGFPEYWAGWRPVMEGLGDAYALAAPDQRGYNLSDAPQSVETYAARNMVADAFAVADHLFGARPFFLAGHDWGASIAYAMAIGQPKRIAGLIIANGVHPVLFQKALIENKAQRQASQYFHYLRADDAQTKMAENGYRRTLNMFERFSSAPWLTEPKRQGYLEAWSKPGRLNAMLNWYRASPIIVPKPGEASVEAPLAHGTPQQYGVNVPHLLIWGAADQALLPAAIDDLRLFAPALKRVQIEDGDHWLIHQHSARISEEIDTFISACVGDG